MAEAHPHDHGKSHRKGGPTGSPPTVEERLQVLEHRIEAFNVLLHDTRNNVQDSMDRLDKIEAEMESIRHEVTLLIKQGALNMANMGAWYEGRISEVKQRLEVVERFAGVKGRKEGEQE